MKIRKLVLPLVLSFAAIGLVSCSAHKKGNPTSTDPTDPSNPSEPTDPTNPSNPSEPTGPTNPVEPDPETPEEVSTIPMSGSGEVVSQGNAQIKSVSGMSEAANVVFTPATEYIDYNVYLKKSGDAEYKKLTSDDYYIQKSSDYKLNIFGLAKGNYALKLSAAKDGNDVGTASFAKISVVNYDRSGFAHFNYTEGVGAYNDDGTLKENAKVLYVTDENKNTVSLTIGDTTVTGIGNILNSVGEEKTSGTASNGGASNTNKGIIRMAAQANIPLVVRIVGTVSESGLYKQGTYNAADAGLIDGLTEYNSKDYGGTTGDNGHMARMKSGKNITIEGVDGCLDGWGLHFMAESSQPTLGKSFEVRNIKFINTPEDAVGMEGVQGVWKDEAHTSYEGDAKATSDLIGSVERCWVHNNEFYSPTISSPAESDKKDGDGSCDFKRGQYFTCSYNYFEGCHKTNLVGSADTSLQFNLTYHHNFWYMCKARGPLTRRANVHMYNNLFYGQTDYALNTRADAYIYSEYNMFYLCKSPYAVEAGAIKSYKDSVASYLSAKGTMATVVTNKSTKVSNNCQFSYRKIDYSSFDTTEGLSYIPNNDYELQTDITDARKVIFAKNGVDKSSQISASNVTMSDISLLNYNTVIKKASPTIHAISSETTVNPGKVSKTAYAFEITNPMKVTIAATTEKIVLVNEAGVCMLSGNGSVVLTPGKYFVQPEEFQPGDPKTLNQGDFKEVTIDSIKFENYDSQEYINGKISEYNEAVANIPSTITYTDTCYNLIKKAMGIYNELGDAKSSVDYSPVSAAYAQYQNLGISEVETAINAIGTVSSNSGQLIATARNKYNELHTNCPSAVVSNYQTLTSAETAFESFAVQACIDAINAIGTVTLDSKDAIEYAETLYTNLSEDKLSAVTNYQTLVTARNKYNKLLVVDGLATYINQSNNASFANEYIELDAETKTLAISIIGQSAIDSSLAAYTITLIDSLPTTITPSNAADIIKAETLYDLITTKNLVSNYDKLVSAREAYNEILSSAIECTFSKNGSSVTISNTTDFHWAQTPSASDKSATINGTNYSGGLKMNSKGAFTFTTTGEKLLTIYATNATTISVDGKAVSLTNGVLTVTLSSGTHTVSKGDAEACVFYVSVA